MAIYRVRSDQGRPITVQHEGTRYYLDPSRPYNTKDRMDKLLVDAFPAFFVSDSDVEQATAAPGEKRNVRRES